MRKKYLHLRHWIGIRYTVVQKIKKNPGQRNSWNQIKNFFHEIAIFIVLNFFSVQKLIFSHFWNCKKWNLVKKIFFVKLIWVFLAWTFFLFSSPLCNTTAFLDKKSDKKEMALLINDYKFLCNSWKIWISTVVATWIRVSPQLFGAIPKFFSLF